jgi:putative component of membrane protein insertase Oxa1/YidC/SpoIIIJ protein YidD
MAVFLIKLYQLLNTAKVQLLLTVFGYASVCHHQPSCSQYTLEHIRTHGTMQGLGKGLWRVLTCW